MGMTMVQALQVHMRRLEKEGDYARTKETSVVQAIVHPNVDPAILKKEATQMARDPYGREVLGNHGLLNTVSGPSATGRVVANDQANPAAKLLHAGQQKVLDTLAARQQQPSNDPTNRGPKV